MREASAFLLLLLPFYYDGYDTGEGKDDSSSKKRRKRRKEGVFLQHLMKGMKTTATEAPIWMASKRRRRRSLLVLLSLPPPSPP